MDEEQLEQVESTAVQTETQVGLEHETKVEDLPRLEDLIKSEKVVRPTQKIDGVTSIESETQPIDRVFKRKSDEKKIHFKKRLKIVTAVYSTIVVLLLGFVITNVATLAILDKKIDANTKTIESCQQQVEMIENQIPTGESLPISVNEPRDYSEDKQELTFLDKLTILFRNLFA